MESYKMIKEILVEGLEAENKTLKKAIEGYEIKPDESA